ncbi:MAG: TadE/TadG family type IV pilus assembly protein [Bacteroidota bacterium]|jgi:Flp pilus assembly protein TadG
MTSRLRDLLRTKRRDRQSLITRWRQDRSGVTAIEFAFVGLPFFMLLFGIMGVGLFFFTTFSLENALERAARVIRTGQAQQTGMTAEQFKNLVCSNAPQFVDCENKLRINVRHYAEADLTPAVTRNECIENNTLTNVTIYEPGAASEVVLVTLCYEWDMVKAIPFLDLKESDMSGARLIQAATVFRSEPFEN